MVVTVGEEARSNGAAGPDLCVLLSDVGKAPPGNRVFLVFRRAAEGVDPSVFQHELRAGNMDHVNDRATDSPQLLPQETVDAVPRARSTAGVLEAQTVTIASTRLPRSAGSEETARTDIAKP
jgi:hypothetical protein